MSYLNGAPEPFPLPTQDGDYTPGIYAIIEWEDGDVTSTVYAEIITAAAAATPMLVSDPFSPALETLLALAAASPSISAEQYVPVAGIYADDLKVNLAVDGSLTTETWISLEVVTVATFALGGGLASEVISVVETLLVPAAVTPKLAAETYIAVRAETLAAVAAATLSLTTDLVERDVVDVAPDLELTVRCYTLGVDVNLFPVYASVKTFPSLRVVNL